jgi:sec-independent protein translocase protein TatB
MFDFSWTEIALIGGVALIVIGPKDLPKALRTAGVWVRKARSISREFQGTIEQMMREAELDEVKKTIEKATSFDFETEIKKQIDPTGDLAESLKPPEMPDLDKLISGADEKPADPPEPPHQSIEPPPAIDALPAPPETAAIEPPPSVEEAPDPLAPDPETERPAAEPAPLVHLATTPESPPAKPVPGDVH